ncbi:MAG: hypothetical protein JSV83_14105 [Desulfobacterales bacterium]|nr:MAG: hypothetical protein JSV83_14105 [Desulfobacterales bacterium]
MSRYKPSFATGCRANYCLDPEKESKYFFFEKSKTAKDIFAEAGIEAAAEEQLREIARKFMPSWQIPSICIDLSVEP